MRAIAAQTGIAAGHGVVPGVGVLGDAFGLGAVATGGGFGEARDVGKVLAGIALHAAQRGQPFSAPCVLLSGGETTVTLRGGEHARGSGGRNVECLLSLALALRGHPRIHALMADTDGVDGAAEIAGAIIGPDILERAWELGLQPAEELDRNNGHGFFQSLGASLITGPTRTNVNDFRVVSITSP